MPFRVTGQVSVVETGIPIPSLRVRIWDRDLVFDDDLGEVITQPDGCFEHTFERKDFDDFGFEPFPDLYLIVTTSEGRLLLDTSDETRYNASENEHFELKLPAASIVEDDGALFWGIRPRVTGTLSVMDGKTEIPAYIDNVADAIDELLIELWDPVREQCLAVDEPTNLTFMLWYFLGSHVEVTELELRVKRSADGTELYKSGRFPVSLDTRVIDIPLQRSALLQHEDPEPLSFSHTHVPANLRNDRVPLTVITVEPAPPRDIAPSGPVSSSRSRPATPAPAATSPEGGDPSDSA